MQRSSTQTNQNTTEYAHLQGFDAKYTCCCTRQIWGTECTNHCTDCGMHNKKCDCSRKCGNFFFLLCHANGNTHCKNKRQILKYNRTCGIEYLKNGIDKGAGAHNRHETIGLQHGFVGKRTANAEE